MNWKEPAVKHNPLDEVILPIRLWLRFCIRHRLPWWAASAGVEVGMATVFVALFLIMVKVVP